MANAVEILSDVAPERARTPLLLVDFWAEWCASCHSMLPILDDIAIKYGETVTVGKLDVFEHPEVAERFGISSLPTLLIFRHGERVRTIFGARSEHQLIQEINDALSVSPPSTTTINTRFP